MQIARRMLDSGRFTPNEIAQFTGLYTKDVLELMNPPDDDDEEDMR